MVCIEREEERDKLEQEEEEQCTQQEVTQCYNEYSTVYTDVVREKCSETYLKTCRIVMREKTYNHTARVCKGGLQKLLHNKLVDLSTKVNPPLFCWNLSGVLVRFFKAKNTKKKFFAFLEESDHSEHFLKCPTKSVEFDL